MCTWILYTLQKKNHRLIMVASYMLLSSAWCLQEVISRNASSNNHTHSSELLRRVSYSSKCLPRPSSCWSCWLVLWRGGLFMRTPTQQPSQPSMRWASIALTQYKQSKCWDSEYYRFRIIGVDFCLTFFFTEVKSNINDHQWTIQIDLLYGMCV